MPSRGPAPVMGRGACLHRNHASRLIGKQRRQPRLRHRPVRPDRSIRPDGADLGAPLRQLAIFILLIDALSAGVYGTAMPYATPSGSRAGASTVSVQGGCTLGRPSPAEVLDRRGTSPAAAPMAPIGAGRPGARDRFRRASRSLRACPERERRIGGRRLGPRDIRGPGGGGVGLGGAFVISGTSRNRALPFPREDGTGGSSRRSRGLRWCGRGMSWQARLGAVRRSGSRGSRFTPHPVSSPIGHRPGGGRAALAVGKGGHAG